MVILFNKTTGDYAAHCPEGAPGTDDDLYAISIRNFGNLLPKDNYDFVSITPANLSTLLTGLEDDPYFTRPWKLLRYEGGQIVLKTADADTARATRQRKAAVKAGKQAAKQAKKLDGFETMTAAEFTALTAAQKWDIVFAFMKVNFPEG